MKTNGKKYCKSDFDVFCIQKKIENVNEAIGKSATLGKIERWHRTYDVERPRFKTIDNSLNATTTK